mmetsp:Transcript_50411/g.151848  ORF Transcript_50411/g.151848 Transcript_50411/m.151848 type:complete len:341 (+) Transcript_50411:473-1495(+)
MEDRLQAPRPSLLRGGRVQGRRGRGDRRDVPSQHPRRRAAVRRTGRMSRASSLDRRGRFGRAAIVPRVERESVRRNYGGRMSAVRLRQRREEDGERSIDAGVEFGRGQGGREGGSAEEAVRPAYQDGHRSEGAGRWCGHRHRGETRQETEEGKEADLPFFVIALRAALAVGPLQRVLEAFQRHLRLLPLDTRLRLVEITPRSPRHTRILGFDPPSAGGRRRGAPSASSREIALPSQRVPSGEPGRVRGNRTVDPKIPRAVRRGEDGGGRRRRRGRRIARAVVRRAVRRRGDHWTERPGFGVESREFRRESSQSKMLRGERRGAFAPGQWRRRRQRRRQRQ